MLCHNNIAFTLVTFITTFMFIIQLRVTIAYLIVALTIKLYLAKLTEIMALFFIRFLNIILLP